MKKGYKGFDKDLKCRGEQFVIGETYTKPEKNEPKVCTSDGYHYCDNLVDVFEFYRNNKSNRFCEIEILGNHTKDNSKCVTTSFKILRELKEEEIDELILEKNMNIPLLKKIMTKYPMFHVGGSVGLFLHGIRLKRWSEYCSFSSGSDLDLITPYYVLIEDEFDGESNVDDLGGKASGNDFDETFLIDNVKVDYRIDNTQKYDIITYNGFKFKVSKFETILEAKLKYSKEKNGKKHLNDIKEMCGLIKEKKELNLLDLFK